MKIPQPNFSKGEISPDLFGRVDTQQYSAGLKKARNWIVRKYGGVSFRPGTRLVGAVDDPTKPVRLIPFQYSIEQSYMLVFGQGSMRPVALGGFVVEQNLKITAITNAAQGKITAALHGYAADDRVYLSGIVGMEALNGRFANVVSVQGQDAFTVDINTLGLGVFVSSDGAVNTAPPPAPPPDPVVPPPTPDPEQPSVGGGGGRDYGWRERQYIP